MKLGDTVRNYRSNMIIIIINYDICVIFFCFLQKISEVFINSINVLPFMSVVRFTIYFIFEVSVSVWIKRET